MLFLKMSCSCSWFSWNNVFGAYSFQSHQSFSPWARRLCLPPDNAQSRGRAPGEAPSSSACYQLYTGCLPQFSSWSYFVFSGNPLLWMSQTAADVQVLVILLLLFWVASLAQYSKELSLTGAHHPRDIFWGNPVPTVPETSPPVQGKPSDSPLMVGTNLTDKVVMQFQLEVLKKARLQTLEKPRAHDWATEYVSTKSRMEITNSLMQDLGRQEDLWGFSLNPAFDLLSFLTPSCCRANADQC